MSQPTVSIIHLDRSGSMGARQRVRSLQAIFDAAGAHTAVIPLLSEHRRRVPIPDARLLGALVRGHAVPESVVWKPHTVRMALEQRSPDLVITVTARAFHPDLRKGGWELVIDFVDQLSASYGDRARLTRNPVTALGFRALAKAHARFESSLAHESAPTIAAGWTDAAALNARWLPITVDVPAAVPEPSNRADLLFFGNLTYPPNAHAVERLGRLWSGIRQRRPNTTLKLAGANAMPRTRELASKHGWMLETDFADVAQLCATARVGIAPLQFASGIQIKVLEAAACGLPQIVDPVALRGFAPGFPALAPVDDESMMNAIVDLLNDEPAQQRLGTEGRRHILDEYSTERWVSEARRLLHPDGTS